jgi:hypothetical protein
LSRAYRGPLFLRKLLGRPLLDDFCVVTGCEWSGPFGRDAVEQVFSGLARFNGLKSLALSAEAVRGERLEAFAALKRIAHLRRLQFEGMGFDDADVEALGGLTGLEELYFQGTFITDGQIKRLKQLLPNCKIVSEGDPGPEAPPSATDH